MSGPVRDEIRRACLSFMIPVARFLIRAGVSYRQFDDVVRVAFVRVASEDYGIRGRPTNISRVSAMTGIPRKDVKALRENATLAVFDRRTDLSPLADILHLWHTHPDLVDESGMPRSLSYHGDGWTFEKVVRQCAGDRPVGAFKAQLLRCGAIKVDDDGLMVPIRRHVVPKSFERKLVTSLSFGLHALASTVAHNTNPDRCGPGRIERFVESNPLPPEAIERLRPLLRSRVVSFSEAIDNIFAAESTAERSGQRRVGIGIYYHEDRD